MRLMIVLLLLVGCAPLTEEAKYKATVDKANWLNCEAEYIRQRKIIYHRHHHDANRISRGDIKDDLLTNDCKRVLHEEWINY